MPENGEKTEKRPRCAAVGERVVYVWIPQKDITVHELAEAQEVLFFATGVALKMSPPSVVDEVFLGMSDGGRRHWRVTARPERHIVTAKGIEGLQLPPGAA
jgi:hypothetical protein